MADITMCRGTGCKLKESCHRFNAKANEYYQWYFEKPPHYSEGEECNYYYKY